MSRLGTQTVLGGPGHRREAVWGERVCMAGRTGLEPATSDVTGRRSDQTELPPRACMNDEQTLKECRGRTYGTQARVSTQNGPPWKGRPVRLEQLDHRITRPVGSAS